MNVSLAALDRLDTISACYRAIEALISPDDNNTVSRDDLAILMSFINSEHHSAIAALNMR